VNLSEAFKRILIGRRLASHQLGETLLRTRLHFIPGIMVITAPYQLRSSQAAIDRLPREDPLAWRRFGTGLSEADLERIDSGS
jgi:hypothetical protein